MPARSMKLFILLISCSPTSRYGVLDIIKGVSSHRRRREGMQLSYSCIEGEMLAVTKFKSRNDAV